MGLPLTNPATRLTDLFYLGVAQPLAAWPNTGYGQVQRSAALPAADKTTFAVAGRTLPPYQTIREDDIGAPKYNLARRNVVVKGKPSAVHKEAAAGIDLGGIAEQGNYQNVLSEIVH